MKFRDIAKAIEAWAPPVLAESYDNVGLLVGEPDTEATGVLINLDVTEALIDEAVAKGCNMIITHHPIWFTGIKRLNGENYVSRIILKAIREKVGLYACHTNLDNIQTGVNRMIGERLGVEKMRVLSTKKDQMRFLVCAVPNAVFDKTAAAMKAAGARNIRNADTANAGLLECTLPVYYQGAVISALRKHHPAANPVIHLMPTFDKDQESGSGMIGELPAPMAKEDFMKLLKERFGSGGIRYADSHHKTIKKVAWCGGAGSFLIRNAISAGADAFFTGDITYHKYFDNEGKILLLDIGHFESEQFTSNLLHSHLSKIFANFAVRLSEINTNPVKYI